MFYYLSGSNYCITSNYSFALNFLLFRLSTHLLLFLSSLPGLNIIQKHVVCVSPMATFTKLIQFHISYKTIDKFRVCKSVHHHTFNWINQQDAATSQVYFSSSSSSWGATTSEKFWPSQWVSSIWSGFWCSPSSLLFSSLLYRSLHHHPIYF